MLSNSREKVFRSQFRPGQHGWVFANDNRGAIERMRALEGWIGWGQEMSIRDEVRSREWGMGQV